MKSGPVALGFILYFLASAGAALFVAPQAGFLMAWLAFAGAYAALLFSAIISFPILVLVFWLANKTGHYGEIPEVSG